VEVFNVKKCILSGGIQEWNGNIGEHKQ
jgi:hypothetical protein